MSNLTDLGIVISNVVGAMSNPVLTVANTRYTLNVKCDLTDSLTAFDEVYLVNGGDLQAKNGSNALIPEADISVRHLTPTAKFVKALSPEGVSTEEFTIAVASPLETVSFDWTPLVALVKDGVTTYEYGDTQRIQTSATVLHQAAIDAVSIDAATPTAVKFELAAAFADNVIIGERFTITLATGTYRGVVGEDKSVVIIDKPLADFIAATAVNGPLSFSHLVAILGNMSFEFEVDADVATTAGFSVIKDTPALTWDGVNLVTKAKGKSFTGAALTHDSEKLAGGLVGFEALLVGAKKVLRVIYDTDAYHVNGGTLNLHWGPELANHVQGTLVTNGAVTSVDVENDALYDYVHANVDASELVNVRLYVTSPAALVDHYGILITSNGAGLPQIVHGDDKIAMVYDRDNSAGTIKTSVNPDVHTTSTDILDHVKLTKLGAVVGSGEDADKVVIDAEGANVGDVITFTSNHNTAALADAPTGTLTAIKRRTGLAFSGVNSSWASYFARLSTPGSAGAVTSYVLAIDARVEYEGEYDVTVGNNGTFFGYDQLFGAINKQETAIALGYVNVTDPLDVIDFAKITGVISNGTSLDFKLDPSSVKATGKEVTLRRSTDETEVFVGTLVRTEAGDISASFGPDLAFTLANEYSDGSIFSFDLSFTGDDNLGDVLVKTAGKDSSVVESTYTTAAHTTVQSVSVDEVAELTKVVMRANDVKHSVYRTTFLENGETETNISNVIGEGVNTVAYPDLGLRTAISKAVYTALNVVALPLGNNAIKVSQQVVGDTTVYGYNADMGALSYNKIIIDGKFDVEAKMLSIEVTEAADKTLTAVMRVNTAGLEAIGKTVTLSTAAGELNGILAEVDGSTYLEAVLTGDAFMADFITTPVDQWIPLSVAFEGNPTLLVPGVLLQGGGSTTIPYSKVEGEETGTLTIDENLPQNGMDNLLSIRVDGNKVLFTTSYPSGSVFVLDKVDGVSVSGGLLTATGIIDGVGRVEFDDAALAALFANSHTNNVVFDALVTLGNPDAEYQVTMAIDPETGYNGYTAGVAGSINKNVLTGQEDKFNVNKATLITDVIVTEDSLVLKLNETAIQLIGKEIELVSVYKSYKAVVTAVGGVPTVNLGAEAFDETSLYPEGFLFGFDLVVTGTGTAFIGDTVMRVAVGTDGVAFSATAQDAPITDPGYIVKEQEISDAMAVKQIVARNDGKTVRLVLG